MCLKRLFTIGFAAAFLAGATIQILPPSTSMADTGGRSDQMVSCDNETADCCQPAAPAKDMPNCIGHFGCLTVPALAVLPTTLPRPFRWVSISYVSGTPSLFGQSVEPELSPPILAV